MNKITLFIFTFLFIISFIIHKKYNIENKTNIYSTKKSIFKNNEDENTLKNPSLFCQEDFNSFVFNIIELYNKKDTKNINRLIHNEIGLYLMYSIGSTPSWTHQKKIHLDTLQRQTRLPYWDRETLAFQQIKFEKEIKRVETLDVLSILDEEDIETGVFFVDDIEFQNRLSFWVKNELENEFYDAKTTQKIKKELKKIKELEQNTHCICAIWKNDFNNFETFIFYVTKIKEKWYLTMIDFSWLP